MFSFASKAFLFLSFSLFSLSLSQHENVFLAHVEKEEDVPEEDDRHSFRLVKNQPLKMQPNLPRKLAHRLDASNLRDKKNSSTMDGGFSVQDDQSQNVLIGPFYFQNFHHHCFHVVVVVQ